MKKFTIWSANTNSDFHEARENGALYPVVLPDNVSPETVTRLLETVGDCYNGDKKSFQFEWEKVPDQYAMITYTKSCFDSMQPLKEPVIKAYMGVYPLYNNNTSHDLKEQDFINFILQEGGDLFSEIRPVTAKGYTTFHYYGKHDPHLEYIIEISRTKTISTELAEQLILVNA